MDPAVAMPWMRLIQLAPGPRGAIHSGRPLPDSRATSHHHQEPPQRSNTTTTTTNRPAAGPSSPAGHHSRLNTRPTPCIRVSTEPPSLHPQNSTGGSQLSPGEGGADKCASYLERFYIQRRGAVHDRGSEVLQHSPKKIQVTQAKKTGGGEGVETGDHHQIKNKNNNNNNNFF